MSSTPLLKCASACVRFSSSGAADADPDAEADGAACASTPPSGDAVAATTGTNIATTNADAEEMELRMRRRDYSNFTAPIATYSKVVSTVGFGLATVPVPSPLGGTFVPAAVVVPAVFAVPGLGGGFTLTSPLETSISSGIKKPSPM